MGTPTGASCAWTKTNNMALRFAFGLLLVASVMGDERASLMALFEATGGADAWTTSTGWGGSTDMCTWFGVQCTHDGSGTHVSSVVLPNNGLKGMLPAELVDLKDIKTLDLSHNKIGGPLPPFFDALNQLQYLRLNNNLLSGALPPRFQNFTYPYPNLQEIQLQYNNITGTIPESMFGPSTEPVFHPAHVLKVLDISYNSITGEIPARLAREQKLVSFLIGGDALSGSVDETVGALLSHIKYCDMSANTFKCPLPSGLDTNCKAVCK